MSQTSGVAAGKKIAKRQRCRHFQMQALRRTGWANQTIAAGSNRGALTGKELCLRGRHYGRLSGAQAKRQADLRAGMHTGRHVQRQAGKDFGLERHYGRLQAKRQAGSGEGMQRDRHYGGSSCKEASRH